MTHHIRVSLRYLVKIIAAFVTVVALLMFFFASNSAQAEGQCRFDGWIKTVDGKAIAGVKVTVFTSDGTYVTETTSAANGGWSISDLAEGTYYFTFAKTGWRFSASPSGKYPITEAISPFICDDVRGAEDSSISAASISSVSVTPSSGMVGDTFTFTVLASNAANAAIYNGDYSYIGAMTKQSATSFTYDYIPLTSGTQTLYFRVSNAIGELSEYASKQITVRQVQSGSLCGYVKDANGLAMKGVLISVRLNGDLVSSVSTDESGYWRADDLQNNVSYNIAAGKQGYAFIPSEVQQVATTNSSQVSDFVASIGQPRTPLDASHFPDPSFRKWCLAQTWGDDAFLTEDEARGIESIFVAYQQLTDLTGIAYFPWITSLDCQGNGLTILDLLGNTKIARLNCSQNKITTLSIASGSTLESLLCAGNPLGQLDVSGFTGLTVLDCGYTRLTTLDTSHNPLLTTLRCTSNMLRQLDLTANTRLSTLDARYCQLKTINLKGTKLTPATCQIKDQHSYYSDYERVLVKNKVSGSWQVDLSPLIGAANRKRVLSASVYDDAIRSDKACAYNVQTGVVTLANNCESFRYVYDTGIDSIQLEAQAYLCIDTISSENVAFTTDKATYRTGEDIAFTVHATEGTQVQLLADWDKTSDPIVTSYPLRGATTVIVEHYYSSTPGMESGREYKFRFQLGNEDGWCNDFSETKSIFIKAALGTLDNPSIHTINEHTQLRFYGCDHWA